ncbi:hypothetical protein FPV67DRAFT_1660670 [Lyophyllum atratum]|nr:hypothetical protein FPV67DRAFT_1660670 [Lyophyllum atratum]
MNHSTCSRDTFKQARGHRRLLPRPEQPKPAITHAPAVKGQQYFSRYQFRYDLAPTNGLKLPVPRRTRVEGLPPNRRTLGQIARWEREYRERQQAPAGSLRSYGVTPTTDKQSRSPASPEGTRAAGRATGTGAIRDMGWSGRLARGARRALMGHENGQRETGASHWDMGRSTQQMQDRH